jgi:hypothetical protein
MALRNTLVGRGVPMHIVVTQRTESRFGSPVADGDHVVEIVSGPGSCC